MSYNNFGDLKVLTPDMFNEPDMMGNKVLRIADNMMVVENKKLGGGLTIHVHSSFRGGDPGQHGHGRAFDYHLELRGRVISVVTAFHMACRYMFTGIGFYPYWNNPGVHVDTRPTDGDYITTRRAFWWKDEEGNYRNIDDFFKGKEVAV